MGAQRGRISNLRTRYVSVRVPAPSRPLPPGPVVAHQLRCCRFGSHTVSMLLVSHWIPSFGTEVAICTSMSAFANFSCWS